MLTIVVNGQNVACEHGISLQRFIEQQGFDPATVVVMRNQTIVKAEAFEATSLEQGDDLEILQFVGGG